MNRATEETERTRRRWSLAPYFLTFSLLFPFTLARIGHPNFELINHDVVEPYMIECDEVRATLLASFSYFFYTSSAMYPCSSRIRLRSCCFLVFLSIFSTWSLHNLHLLTDSVLDLPLVSISSASHIVLPYPLARCTTCLLPMHLLTDPQSRFATYSLS